MVRSAVRSSSVLSVGYDGEQQVLEVEFGNGGIYRYLDVPAEVYRELLKCDSIGGFVNRKIKPFFRVFSIDTAEAA
jgi:hypothetical protein